MQFIQGFIVGALTVIGIVTALAARASYHRLPPRDCPRRYGSTPPTIHVRRVQRVYDQERGE